VALGCLVGVGESGEAIEGFTSFFRYAGDGSPGGERRLSGAYRNAADAGCEGTPRKSVGDEVPLPTTPPHATAVLLLR